MRRPAGIAVLALGLAAGCGAPAKEPPPAEPPAEAGAAAAAPKLCEHGVPAELCTRCSPELVPVFQATGDWCEEHGVPESQCLRCNPGLRFEAAAPPADWCGEHGVPESKCTKCNPKLVATYVEAGDFCREHGLPASVCPRCDPSKLAGRKAPVFPEPGTKVTLASAGTERDAGIRAVPVTRRPFSRSLEVVGKLELDRNRYAQVSTRGEALVVEVKVDVGDEVRAGDPLVVVASSAIGEDRARLAGARARVTAARSALERQGSLLASKVASAQEVEDAARELAVAEADAQAAEAALRSAGASSSGGSGERHVLTAPLAGTVVARPAVTGRTFEPGEILVEVAELSRLWAVLDVPEDDAGDVRPGQRVVVKLEGARGEVREGTIARVGAVVDPTTRTVPARIELPNPDRRLKAGSFVRAEVHVADAREALLVPKDAVQRAEGATLVFVRKAAGSYVPVAVELGARTEAEVEVTKGLAPDDRVVTEGAFLLKTELLKDSIGAGCCETD